MTRLVKPVTRHSEATIRDCGKIRELVVTLYPGDTIGLRPAGTRRKREELTTLRAVYDMAVRQRVQAERSAKLAAKKARKS